MVGRDSVTGAWIGILKNGIKGLCSWLQIIGHVEPHSKEGLSHWSMDRNLKE